MKRELDKLLCERYPKIFAERHAPMTQTAMCWGFECDDGWFDIINTLCGNIQNYIDWQNKTGKNAEQVVAEQVKEKFGTLRFYYRGGDDYIRGLVTMAESMSGLTCEVCGKPGSLNDVGWLMTLCEEHRVIDNALSEMVNQNQQLGLYD